MNNRIEISKGPAAANIYMKDQSNNTVAHLLLDWSYDSIDYKFKNDSWISINSELNNLNSSEKINIFKLLASEACNNLKNYSDKSNQILEKLEMLVSN